MASGLRTDDPGSGTDTHRHRFMHSSSSGTGNEISNCHRNRSGDLAIVGKGNGKGREEGGNRDRGEVKEEGAEYSQVHGNDLKLPLVIPSDHLPTHFIPYPDFNQPSSSTAPSSETHHILPGGSIILKRGMACTFCRRRKLRCSGEKPKCANCARYHQDCEYLTRKEPPEIEVEITDSPVVYPSPFTAVPLPTDRGPAPPQPERRSWRRASIQRPFDFEPWSRRNSIQRDDHFTPGRGPDDLWGSRPGLGGIRSAPTRRVSPLTPQVGLPSVDDTSTTPQQGSSTSTAAGTSAGSWAHQEAPSMPRHDSGSAPLISPPIAQHQSSPTIPTPVHYEGVPMTQPQPTPPLPIPVHYERITPIPPPVQYPAVNETAWYQAALNLDPQQMFGETYHPPVQQSQQQEHYPPPPPAPEPHYPAYEGYRDISSTFDSSANVGPNPLPLSASIAPPGSSMSYPPPPPHVYHGPGPGPMAMSHGSSMGGYDMPGPSPYASQVNLPLHSAPVTMPIYGHNPYSTPEIDGYRPGLVHEGMYPPAPSSGGFGGYDPNSRVFQESHSMVPAPSSTQFHPPPSMDGFPLHGNQIQNTTPYTFPAMSIPLPEDTTYFDRPPIPRAVSNPTNLNAVSENTTPSHSDGSVSQAPTTTTVNVSVPEGEYYPQNMNVMYPDESGPSKIDKLSERLGEFFLGPEKKEMNGAAGNEDQGQRAGAERHIKKSRKSVSGAGGVGMSYSPSHESDGLSETARNALLDTFFEHHKMFIDLSIPRFKSRLTFHDRRRPSLALLNAMYMWATRMSHPPNMSTMETHFYQQAIVHLDASAATGDRLMDCIRAAFLLSAFQYMNGRHHSGYLLCGHSAQLVKSCGLHRIESTVFTPAPPINPFLRNRPYLLPPPEDALELGERIHTFWAVFSLDRSSSALTGFTSSFRDSDVTTPWPRELSDIASGNVTTRDDVTVRDLYRHAYQHPNERSYLRWIKAVTILERASKLVLIDPEDSSEHTNQWTYHLSNPGSAIPPGYLESPRYRVPTEFEEVKYALEHLIAACGDEGVYPVEQKKEAVKYGKEEVVISPAVILFHHVVAAIQTLLYDTNSLDAENTEALVGARKAVELIKELPPLPVHAVDAFAPLTWVMVAKVLIKEMYRLKRLGDQRHRLVEEEVQCLIDEINRVGLMMPPSKMYAKGVEDLLKYGNLQAEHSFTNTTTNGRTIMTNTTGMDQYPQHY